MPESSSWVDLKTRLYLIITDFFDETFNLLLALFLEVETGEVCFNFVFIFNSVFGPQILDNRIREEAESRPPTVLMINLEEIRHSPSEIRPQLLLH